MDLAAVRLILSPAEGLMQAADGDFEGHELASDPEWDPDAPDADPDADTVAVDAGMVDVQSSGVSRLAILLAQDADASKVKLGKAVNGSAALLLGQDVMNEPARVKTAMGSSGYRYIQNLLFKNHQRELTVPYGLANGTSPMAARW